MGACGCGGDAKEKEIDLYMDKHHRVHIVTAKDNYEVSGLSIPKNAINFKAKKGADVLLIDDEK